MRSSIRLDDKGNAYLVCCYDHKEGAERNALDDAERIFFTKLSNNGGLIHLVPGRGNNMRLIVTTGSLKRQPSMSERFALGDLKPRDTTTNSTHKFTPSDHTSFIKEDKGEEKQNFPMGEILDEPEEG